MYLFFEVLPFNYRRGWVMVGSVRFCDSHIAVSGSLTASCTLRNPSYTLTSLDLNVDVDHAEPITLFMTGS